MKRYVIDTNCLISYVTDRNLKQQEKIADYFKDAADLKLRLVILCAVLTELVYVFLKVYNIDERVISGILSALDETPGIEIENYCSLPTVLSLWPDKIRDYGDAVIAAYARDHDISVITFDKDFQAQLDQCGVSIEKPV